MKKNFKNNHYPNRLEKYQNDIKKTWDVIKEIKGKAKSSKDRIP